MPTAKVLPPLARQLGTAANALLVQSAFVLKFFLLFLMSIDTNLQTNGTNSLYA